ncbi:putative pilus system protein FilA [Acinetobacter sp. NS4_7]
MKKFTKLALVSSIALTTNAMAMQAMDDTALSTTTGQDGLSIGIGISKIEIEKLLIHDNDGLAAKGAAGDAGFGGSSTAGAIVIKGNGIAGNANEKHGIVIGANYDDNGAYLLTSRNLADLVIDTDAGTGTNSAFINVAAQVSGLDIKIGEIGVSASNAMPAAGATNIRRGNDDTNYNAILSGLTLKTGKMDANIQLGAAPQGAMIKLNTTMVGGLEIQNLGILDNSTKGKAVGAVNVGGTPTPVTTKEAGEIFIESIKIADANGKDLTLSQDIQVFNNAYVGGGTTLGKAAHIRIVSNDTGAKDQYIKGIHLGSRTAKSIGDMEVQGLQTYFSPAAGVYTQGAVITISGH